MSTIVKLAITPNAGYGADQATNGLTLADLLAEVEQAIEFYGEDAEVVTIDGSNAYGAKWGHLDIWDRVFTLADGSDEDDYY